MGRRRRRMFSGASEFLDTFFAAGEAGDWWTAADLTTLFTTSTAIPGTEVVNDGDIVGSWRGQRNGHLLFQSTGSARPLYHTAAGQHWIEGDGTSDFLRAAFPITQPWHRISCIQQVTWTANDMMFGGVSADAGRLYQRTASPDIAIFDGAPLEFVGTPTLAGNMVITERHDGANSRIAFNSEAYTTGNTGVTLPGGVTVLASNAGLAWANARIYGFFMRAGPLTDQQITDIRQAFADMGGVVL